MSVDEYLEINGKKVKMPNIALGKVIPPKIEMDILKEEAREKREFRRFVITLVVSCISAVAAVVSATVSIMLYLAG